MTIKLASGIAALGKTRFLMATIAAATLAVPAAASAEIVTATFTGTVNFVFDTTGGLPPASDGDTLVATYVFDIDQATGSSLLPTGGDISGPYGSFVTASVSINETTGALPAFTTGELTGETQVFDTGSVVDAYVSGAPGVHLDSNITGTDFGWILASPVTGFSYSPSETDQTLIQLGDASGDLVEADVSSVDIAVSSTAPATPEPATWAMMLIGFVGMGVVSYRAHGRGLAAISQGRRSEARALVHEAV